MTFLEQLKENGTNPKDVGSTRPDITTETFEAKATHLDLVGDSDVWIVGDVGYYVEEWSSGCSYFVTVDEVEECLDNVSCHNHWIWTVIRALMEPS